MQCVIYHEIAIGVTGFLCGYCCFPCGFIELYGVLVLRNPIAPHNMRLIFLFIIKLCGPLLFVGPGRINPASRNRPADKNVVVYILSTG